MQKKGGLIRVSTRWKYFSACLGRLRNILLTFYRLYCRYNCGPAIFKVQNRKILFSWKFLNMYMSLKFKNRYLRVEMQQTTYNQIKSPALPSPNIAQINSDINYY